MNRLFFWDNQHYYPIKYVAFKLNPFVSIQYFFEIILFWQTFFNQNTISLNLSTLKKGLYLVLINNNQEIYSQKIILK